MTRFFTLRLACGNLRRGYQTYAPFLLATSLLTFSLFAFNTMAFNPGLAAMESGGVLFTYMLNLGSFVVTAFTYIFLFYADSFLIKRRKTEFGLYGVLGMERRHIVAVMFWELALILLLTLGVGMGLGTALIRLLFLLLRALTRLDIPLTSVSSPQAMAATLVLIGVLFAALFVYNALQVRLAKPIDLLHARQQGEKEPPARWLFTLIGLAAMIGGYVIAARVDNPLTALGFFFVAVMLVILGTYLLFITGSISLLKLFRARKSFYYKPGPFVGVSGMMFRMKQNAAGLASICILCTMAMVTFGATGALYLSLEQSLNNMNPVDVDITTRSERDLAAVDEALLRLDAERGVTATNRHTYRMYESALYWQDGRYVPTLEASVIKPNDYVYLVLIPLEDFNAMEGTDIVLGEGELGFCGDGYRDTMTFIGREWSIRKIDTMPRRFVRSYGAYPRMILVTPDFDTLTAMAEENPYLASEQKQGVRISYALSYDHNLSGVDAVAYETAVQQTVGEAIKALHQAGDQYGYGTSMRALASVQQYATFGTLLFVGVFLGLIFLAGTALIIYFKQLSEGHQDRERFVILQKVGMEAKLVRRSVRSQVLLVFLLPLAVALCHVTGSLNLISLMLGVFGIADRGFIKLCSVGSALVVAAVYLAFYFQTAHSYYKLVRWEVRP